MFDIRKLKAQLVMKGMSVRQLAERLGMDESTFYRKMNANGAFSRQQINDMIEILDIKNPMEIFFASELA